MLGAKRICRVRIAKDELEKMSKEDLHKSWLLQEQYIDYIEAKIKENIDQTELMCLRESEEKLKLQQLELARRENILVMRLTVKEQEVQEYCTQLQEMKSSVPSSSHLRSASIDPAVNLVYEKMRKEIDNLKARHQETTDELNAWKFTPDSNTGKRLMAKCRLLHQENEELGKSLSSGRYAKLEGDLALQKNFSEEMKKSQLELDEFVMELDEDVEGMQSTIYYLQQQLRESKEQIMNLTKEHKSTPLNIPINHCIETYPKVISEEKPNVFSSMVKSPGHLASAQPLLDLNIPGTLSNVDKDLNSGQSWPPPSYTDQMTGTLPLCNPGFAIKVDVEDNFLPKQPSPQSKLNLTDTGLAISHNTSNQLTITTGMGSMHMEEYDSEQEHESSFVNITDRLHNTRIAMDFPGAEQEVQFSPPPPPPVGQKKGKAPAKKRTSENGSRGRRRTKPRHTPIPLEQPTVKRLRRRNIIVGQETCDIEPKRQTLEIDTDTEVQVAHTLAQWAATNKERKDLHNINRDCVMETLGNGEIKGNKASEKAARENCT